MFLGIKFDRKYYPRKSGWDRAQPGPIGMEICAEPGRDGFLRAGPDGPDTDPWLRDRLMLKFAKIQNWEKKQTNSLETRLKIIQHLMNKQKL